MHELSIAQNILEIIQEHVDEKDSAEVQAIKVRVGDLSGVVVDSLEFCFSAVVSDSALKNAVLKIERVPARVRCSTCGKSCAAAGWVVHCPACGNGSIELVSGTELQVVEIEVADSPSEAL